MTSLDNKALIAAAKKIAAAYRDGFADVPDILASVASLVEPPPRLSADQWADQFRVMPPGSPMPGPWKTALVPYTIPIYHAFEDPNIETVVGVMGAQMSKTETYLNLLGKWFDIGPLLPALYVGPTQKQVSTMSGDRFKKLIESTPRLNRRLAKGQADKVVEKFFAGVRLGFAWAGSATELASNPCARVLVDERDRMDNDVDGEGDPVEIVRARMDAYAGQRKLGIFSTPTIDGASPVWILFEEGTMHKWAWQCKHCHEWFIPRLEYLIYPDRRTHTWAELAAGAVVACPNCGGEHVDADRLKLNAKGKYIAHVLDENGEHQPVETPPPNKTASFWVSGLCSPFVTFGDRAERLAKAYASKDQNKIQAAINTGFGELFKVKGDAPEWEQVYNLRIDVDRGVVPTWATLLTYAADVQKNGIYYGVRAWGFDHQLKAERSHLVDHGFIAGDTEFDDVYLAWQAILSSMYYAADLDRQFSVDIGLIDSGYNPGGDRFKRPEHKIYDVCRRVGWKAFPTKGHATRAEPMTLKTLDKFPNGAPRKTGVRLWHVDTDHFKTWLMGIIRQSNDQELPLWTLHNEVDEAYCRQVVAEQLVVKPSGQRVWLAKKDNHYNDVEVLNRAAAHVHRAKLLPSFQAPDTKVAPSASPAPTPRPAGSHFSRVGNGSFFRR